MKHLDPRRLTDLCRLLEQLRAGYDELANATRQKIEAMRTANLALISGCASAEERVLAHLKERMGLRAQLMDALGIQMGMPRGMGKQLTLNQLCERLDSKWQSSIQDAAESLRGAACRAAHANRVAGTAARDLLMHLRWVFDAVKPGCEAGCYSRGGNRLAVSGTTLLDTVG